MAAGSGDDNFDWVTAQATCSAPLMFQKLQDGVRADVERRNGATFGRTDDWRFEFHQDEDGFEVVRIGGPTGGVIITFQREGPRINISGDGIDIMLTAIVGISAAGVRKLALEQLFFEEPDDE